MEDPRVCVIFQDRIRKTTLDIEIEMCWNKKTEDKNLLEKEGRRGIM